MKMDSIGAELRPSSIEQTLPELKYNIFYLHFAYKLKNWITSNIFKHTYKN